MNRDAQAIALIGQIHRASVRDLSWREFAEELSNACGKALVTLSIELPQHSSVRERHSAGLGEDFSASLARAWPKLLPWRPEYGRAFVGAFAPSNKPLGELTLEDTDLYREWMAPRNLPAVWPICLLVQANRGIPGAGIMLMRPPGDSSPFSQDELGLLNLLVLHLERAIGNYIGLMASEWKRRALEEVVDRMRLGVFLLNSERQLVRTNPSAERVLAEAELLLQSRAIHAVDPGDDRQLQEAIGRALENAAHGHFHLEENLLFVREDGAPHLELIVKALLSGSPGSVASEAVVAILAARPDEVSIFPGHLVRRLYSLTAAEADLLHLLVDGATLKQAAERRGVATATARSQLKAIFAKTGTRRQGELVQRVLAGIMAVWQAQKEADREARVLSPPGGDDD